MSISLTVFLVILGSAIVTFIPRVLPFLVVRNLNLPQSVIKWLSFIPICILTALIVDSFLIDGDLSVSIDWNVLFAIIPTLIVAIWTKSLSLTVIFGIVCMAGIRYFL
ncbi:MULTISPECIES: AzlD domain-containing protein [Bacillus]|uniref:AzlD domain-containing protein n=1 Tax=Bacillus TaxID=1386 RepID=UPI00031DB1F9|nr:MULTISPECIES: AzlD domain-containing protein [Bacillus]